MSALPVTPPVALSDEDLRLARQSSETLQEMLRLQETGQADASFQTAVIQIRIEHGGDNAGKRADVTLPKAALPLLLSILKELGYGNGVTVIATDTEVTTQQAADFLRVSRPYIVKLLEHGKIPYRTVGPRRRIRVKDLLVYKDNEEAGRHRGLDALTAEAQNLGMY